MHRETLTPEQVKSVVQEFEQDWQALVERDKTGHIWPVTVREIEQLYTLQDEVYLIRLTAHSQVAGDFITSRVVWRDEQGRLDIAPSMTFYAPDYDNHANAKESQS